MLDHYHETIETYTWYRIFSRILLIIDAYLLFQFIVYTFYSVEIINKNDNSEENGSV